MGVDAVHPKYSERLEDWEQLRDCYAGPRRVKSLGVRYLPPAGGMEVDGMGDGQPGRANYDAYVKRAVFHDLVKDAVRDLTGLMHREPARIELPKALEGLEESATPDGLSLQGLLRRINEQQLLFGRLGLLVEVPDGQPVGEVLPFIATYTALTVINWDAGTRAQGKQALEMVVLDESDYDREGGFTWKLDTKYRVLMRAQQAIKRDSDDQADAAEGDYMVAVLSDGNLDPAPGDFSAPAVGGKTMDRIPFVFVNAVDLAPDPDEPPLLGLSNIALTLYRGEADYRQALYLQGQETLVITGRQEGETGESVGVGGSPSVRTGAGAVLDLPTGGTAEYIGASALGLDAMKAAIDADKDEAAQRGGALLRETEGDASSGKALSIRVAAQTASLTLIAKTGAEALRQALRMMAEWVGADPDEVVVEPNLNWAEDEMGADELVKLMEARGMGAPLSLESIHRLMRRRDMTEMTFEDEVALVDEENVSIGIGTATDPVAKQQRDEQARQDDLALQQQKAGAKPAPPQPPAKK